MKLTIDKIAKMSLNTNCNLLKAWSILFFRNNQLLYLLLLSRHHAPGLTAPGRLQVPAWLPGPLFYWANPASHQPGPARPSNCGPHNSFVTNIKNTIFWRRNSKPASVAHCSVDCSSPAPGHWVPVFCRPGCCSSGVGVRGRYSQPAQPSHKQVPSYLYPDTTIFLPRPGLLIGLQNCLSSSAWARPCTPTNIGTLNLSWLLLRACYEDEHLDFYTWTCELL